MIKLNEIVTDFSILEIFNNDSEPVTLPHEKTEK